MTTFSDSQTPDDIDALDALASGYVLGTLPIAQRREVEARLPQDAALRSAVQGWEERLHPLTALVPPVEPQPSLWNRIEGSLGWSRAQQAVATATADSGLTAWWNSVRLWRGLAGGGFTAAAVLAAVLVTRVGAPTAPQYMVVLVAPGETQPGWVVQAAASSGDLSLVPLRQTAVPQGKSLQFWTKADQWTGPKSLGLVQPGETIKVPIDRLPPLEANQLFELTLEPEAGSPLDRPTGPIVFIGRAVKML